MEVHHLKVALCLTALALPLQAAVPDGYIVKVDSATVYLDWGKASGVGPGDTFKIYRAGEPLKHPVTGEVLGQTQTPLGQGMVNQVEDKFSTGKLIEPHESIKAGDRTLYVESGKAAAASAPSSAPATVPQELWHSDPLSGEASGLVIGDIDGDGKKELVVAFHDHVEAFRWNNQKLESLAIFKSRNATNFLAVDTMDMDGSGHDKIFASYYVQGVKRAHVLVLDFSQGALHEVGKTDGFVRTLEHSDGKRELIWQDTSLAQELRIKPPAPFTKTAKGYREGSVLKLKQSLNDDQLFGYAWGDWDGDGSEDFAYLQNGERLLILFKSAKWSSPETVGGSKMDFEWEHDQFGTVYPRLQNWKTAQGKPQLLVPHNIAFLPFKFSRLKVFKSAEIIDLAWNGSEMESVWKLPIPGMLADFGVGDVQQTGAAQLWAAVVGDKTILHAYQLP